MYMVCALCVCVVCRHNLFCAAFCGVRCMCMPSVLRTCLMNNNANYTVGVQTVNHVM